MEGDSDSSSAPIPIVIPVVGTLDDLPNLAALESNVEANTAEITLLNDKILSVNPEDTEKPVHKQLFLTIFDAKTYKFHKQELRTKHGQEDGIIFIFEMSVIDEERLVSGDTEKNAVDALSNDSEDANERVAINNPSIAWSQPFKSCFMAAWQPGGVVSLKLCFSSHTISYPPPLFF